jgi:hypothetical protein
MKPVISIDPSHSGFGIAWLTKHYRYRHDPTAYSYLTGKDKPGIGCPNLCHTLYETLGDLRYWIIVIEEPRSHGNMNPVISLNRDIGYIACRFKEATIITCQASDWKKHLEKYDYLPPKSGNIKPDKYKSILDAHFEIEMVADAWSAWGICLWALENMESE